MLVSELIDILQGMDMPGARVILMGDPEGNAIWDVDDVSDGGFDGQSTFPIEEVEEDEGDVVCVCIWPKHVEGS